MNQTYSPKLKRAMLAIRQILEDENIAGLIVVHTPGFVDSFVRIDPAYSCCRIEKNEYKIRALLHEDFGGDKKAMEARVVDTSDMLNAIVTTAARITLPLGKITVSMNRMTDTDDPQINN